MEYPHGHVGHHRHQNHRDDDNNNLPPPPPQPFGGGYNPPPPQHDSYGGGYNSAPPPPQQHGSYGGGYNSAPHQHDSYGGGYNSAPPPQHESYGGGGYNSGPPAPPRPQQHDSYGGGYNSGPPAPPPTSYGGGPAEVTQAHHGYKPHMPSFHGSHTQSHEPEYQSGGPGMGSGSGLGQLESKPSSQIHCKAGGERFVFGIRDGKVLLTHPDSSDPTQQWYKDEKYSTKVKDKEGHPCFMLVNKGTGQAVKHSISCHPVQLTPYQPDVLDEAVLWSESKDLGSGYRTIRTVNNIHLVMDAWNADKDHGGIHDGTVIALYETWKGDNQNQQWKFVRH